MRRILLFTIGWIQVACAQAPLRIDTTFPKDLRDFYECYSWNSRDGSEPFLETAVRFNGKNFHPIDHTPMVTLGPEGLGPYWREINAWDSSNIYVYAPGVTPENAQGFEYRVLLDAKTVIVPWRSFDRFTNDSVPQSFGHRCGFLGGYNTTWDHYIVAELRARRGKKFLASAVVYWQQAHPHLFSIYKPDELGAFLEMNEFLSTLSNDYNLVPRPEYRQAWLKQYTPGELDSVYGYPKHLQARSDENNIIFFLDQRIVSRKALEYKLVKDGREVIPWKTNDFDLNFIWLKDLGPGEYRLGMRFTDQRHNPSEYPFTIHPVWTQTWWFRTGVVLVGALLLLLVILLVRFRQKSVAERYKRERLFLELKSIRSQLNPHFIFNALSSIQGLINKNDVPNANRYLSDFGSLMRNSLKGSRTDFTPLQTEIQTLDTYLKLEQLRFPFVYQIHTAPDLPTGDLEVPSLLLQPLVENAVKHGVSSLQTGGLIDIDFARENATFTCTIRDNGTGFDPATTRQGFGLSLTQDRIRLLNEVLEGQSLSLQIQAAPGKGTRVVLVFENWIQ